MAVSCFMRKIVLLHNVSHVSLKKSLVYENAKYAFTSMFCWIGITNTFRWAQTVLLKKSIVLFIYIDFIDKVSL